MQCQGAETASSTSHPTACMVRWNRKLNCPIWPSQAQGTHHIVHAGVRAEALLLHHLKCLQAAPPLAAALVGRNEHGVGDGVGAAAAGQHSLKSFCSLGPHAGCSNGEGGGRGG